MTLERQSMTARRQRVQDRAQAAEGAVRVSGDVSMQMMDSRQCKWHRDEVIDICQFMSLVLTRAKQ